MISDDEVFIGFKYGFKVYNDRDKFDQTYLERTHYFWPYNTGYAKVKVEESDHWYQDEK